MGKLVPQVAPRGPLDPTTGLTSWSHVARTLTARTCVHGHGAGPGPGSGQTERRAELSLGNNHHCC